MDNSRVNTIIKSATDTLITDLEAGHSDTLKAYLQAMARFHRYSFTNTILIYCQRKDATHVAGFNTWRKMDRYVKRGEHGIQIYVPMVFRNRPERRLVDDEQPERSVGFTSGFVFDISQTDGEPLPEFSKTSGQVGCYLERLKCLAERRGIELTYEAYLMGADGQSTGGAIKLLEGLTPASEFAVLVHELAHELLHKGDRRHSTCKTLRETEAEAVAFIVSSAIGLNAGTSSSDYIQLYQGDAQLLTASLNFIQCVSGEILGGIL